MMSFGIQNKRIFVRIRWFLLEMDQSHLVPAEAATFWLRLDQYGILSSQEHANGHVIVHLHLFFY